MPYIIPSSSVTPGTVYQPKKSKLILDQISGAIAAWSTRRLIYSTPADIARGRDASTNEEDFTAEELAGTGFTTLAGAGDGFYVTLYDQIGSNNATQATAASQPKGVDTGTLITDGDVPVLDFDGSDDWVELDSRIIVSGDFTYYFKIKFDVTTVQYLFFGSTYQNSFYFNNPTRFDWRTQIGGIKPIGLDLTIITGVYYSVCLTRESGLITLYIDGVAQTTTINAAEDTNIDQITSSAADRFNGCLSDVIIFNRALSASEVTQLHTALA